jgi:hypothetical protein
MPTPSAGQLLQEVKSETHTDDTVISKAKFFNSLGIDFVNFDIQFTASVKLPIYFFKEIHI